MGHEQFDLSRYTPFLLNRTGSKVASKFSEMLKEYKMDIVTWRLTAALNYRGSMRIGELAMFSSIELWTVSRVLTKLEKRGLVERVRVGVDARAVEVSLTDEGTALANQIIPRAREFESLPLNGFSETEIDQLHSMLNRLFENLEERENKGAVG